MNKHNLKHKLTYDDKTQHKHNFNKTIKQQQHNKNTKTQKQQKSDDNKSRAQQKSI